MPERRKYFIAVLVIFGLLGAGAIAIAMVVVSALRQSIGTPSQVGAAHISIQGPFSGRYTASATFLVPRSPDVVHSSPSLQIELLHAIPNDRIEGGLERPAAHQYQLRAFVDYAFPGQRPQIRELGVLPDGPHRVTISADGPAVAVGVDGRTLYTVRSTAFARTNVSRITVGTYVGLSGEHGTGTISDIALTRDGKAFVPIVSPCVLTTHGLLLNENGHGVWTLAGVNDPSRPPAVHCKG